MRKLAKTYGLSDVGLAKVCTKHDIPRPPRGYWAQKQLGYSPEQTPLSHRFIHRVEQLVDRFHPVPSKEPEGSIDDWAGWCGHAGLGKWAP